MDTFKKEDKFINILLTGGHGATTGIATVKEIVSRYPNAKISWIGAKSFLPGTKISSLEYKIYPSMGVKYYAINAGKLQTKFTRYTLPLILLIPVGFIQAFFTILKIKPKVILSFGGFASYPVVFWGKFFKIPVILHEQTIAAGRASIASARFADKIALARPESRTYFPGNKCVVTGNPLMPEIVKIKPKTILSKTPVILVMGGSRGSEFINEEISKIVPILKTRYKIIHVTGERDYLKYKSNEDVNYKVLAYIEPFKMAEYYEDSDLIISRSGANTVAEIIAVKRPAILIPLPRTFMKEQEKNAEYASKFGLAHVMPETEVNETSLMKAVFDAFDNWLKIVRRVAGHESPDLDASKRLVDVISEFV